MPIFRVACETYDRAWYVRARTEKKAVRLVRELTEEYGWHLEYPEEERIWDCDKVFTKDNEVIEQRDL